MRGSDATRREGRGALRTGGEECGRVLSRRDGRPVVALWCYGDRATRLDASTSSHRVPRGRLLAEAHSASSDCVVYMFVKGRAVLQANLNLQQRPEWSVA